MLIKFDRVFFSFINVKRDGAIWTFDVDDDAVAAAVVVAVVVVVVVVWRWQINRKFSISHNLIRSSF